jgi:ribosomal protein S18/ribosomal protein S6
MTNNLVKNYELYFILGSEVTPANQKTTQEKVAKLLENELKATNIDVVDEGAKKLAYPIKKHKLGFYVIATFDIDSQYGKNISIVEKKLNILEDIIRYIIVDQTDYNKSKAKESLNKTPTTTTHNELNKGRYTKKNDITKHLGMREVDYKDVEFLNQFTSPYHKIFDRSRTGTSAKMQRRITQAIKRARHMALMAFTPKHERMV